MSCFLQEVSFLFRKGFIWLPVMRKAKNKHAYKYVKNYHKSSYDKMPDELENSYYQRWEEPKPCKDRDVIPAVQKIILDL